MGWPGTGRRRERSDQPLGGYKLAHPMVSADGTKVGFSGVTVGRGHVYRTVDDAICVQGGTHSCPSRWCDCGFYCFHDIGAARDLACDPEHRDAVLLHVAASGRYRRYERGVRYARQRVRSVQLGRCGCGRPATGFADSGSGSVGWRRLVQSCPLCVGTRPRIDIATFGRLAGPGVTVACEPGVAVPERADTPGLVAVLSAEMALLQARLDEMQSRLEELTRGG
ncbi:MAG: hypothetical protein QOG20_4786 [Pseudonocardiales bacterium]|jgi:hypothetical protein|nr:hypothetical protein [Pseudonocardiales bacterium]